MEYFHKSLEIDMSTFVMKLTRAYLEQNRELEIKETSRLITCTCSKCNFKLVYNKDASTITESNTTHQCEQTNEPRLALPKIFINRCVFQAFVHGKLTKSGVKSIINEDLTRAYSFSDKEDMSIANAIKTLKKEMGINVLDGWSYIESFLRKYSNDNGGDLVSLEYNDSRISRMFIKTPYTSVIEGFKEKLLFMDGCFVAASYGGCLLILITVSPEKKLIPISMCYCSSESKENTMFFLDKNRNLLTDGTTVITDHAKAFEEALKNYPVRHGLCLFHLVQKLKNQAREHIEIMAKTDSQDVYELHKRILERDYPSVYRKLVGYLDKYFFYDGAPKRFGYLSSSPIESFNSLMLEERKDSIIKIFDRFIELSEKACNDVKTTLRQRYNQTQIQAFINECTRLPEKTTSACPLWILDMIDKTQDNRMLEFIPSLSNSRTKVFLKVSSYKGFSGIDRYTVNTSTGECTCGRTSDYGYPCPHLQKAIGRKSIEFISDFWNLSKMGGFLKVSFVRTTTSGLEQSTVDVRPETVLKPGRPKSRFKTFGEMYWKGASKKLLTDALVSVESNPKQKLLTDYKNGIEIRNETQSSSYLSIKAACRLVQSAMKVHSLNKRKILIDKVAITLDRNQFLSLKVCKKETSQLCRYARSVLARNQDDNDVKKVYDTLIKERSEIISLIESYERLFGVYEKIMKLVEMESNLKKIIDAIALDFDND